MFEVIGVISICITIISCFAIYCGVGFRFKRFEFWILSGLRNAEVIKKKMELEHEETGDERKIRIDKIGKKIIDESTKRKT